MKIPNRDDIVEHQVKNSAEYIKLVDTISAYIHAHSIELAERGSIPYYLGNSKYLRWLREDFEIAGWDVYYNIYSKTLILS